MAAASANQLEVVEWLGDRGGNFDRVDNSGLSVLEHAFRSGSDDVVKWITEKHLDGSNEVNSGRNHEKGKSPERPNLKSVESEPPGTRIYAPENSELPRFTPIQFLPGDFLYPYGIPEGQKATVVTTIGTGLSGKVFQVRRMLW
jgi:hypothetical protein